MSHGCKCDCWWCKTGRALGLVAEADDAACCPPTKKSPAKKKVAKKTVKKTTRKAKR